MRDAIEIGKVSARAFCDALFDPGADVPAGLSGPDGAPAPKRFNVYRNNVIVSLSEALGKTFPAIKALLGDEYFSALARAFVVEHPPKTPVLMWYGAEFAGFLDTFPPLQAYRYLPDVARLEWEWLQAYHAADATPLDPARLSEIAPEQLGSVRFKQHPAASLVASDWPIWDLIHANRFDLSREYTVDLETSQHVLVTRPLLEVDLLQLRPGGAVFFSALFDNATLGDAAEAAQASNAAFSLSDTLSDGLSKGVFADLETA